MSSDPILNQEIRRHIHSAMVIADQMNDTLVAAHLCSALEALGRSAHRTDIDHTDGG